jgi:hypothetical protein
MVTDRYKPLIALSIRDGEARACPYAIHIPSTRTRTPSFVLDTKLMTPECLDLIMQYLGRKK